MLTDIKMPGIDGITTARKIREKFRDTRIIVIYGGGKAAPEPYEPDAISTRSYLASANIAGADRTLTKPFDRQEILRGDFQTLDTIDEFEREAVPPGKVKGFKSFLGMVAGEHIAGTEFVIGPLWVWAKLRMMAS